MRTVFEKVHPNLACIQALQLLVDPARPSPENDARNHASRVSLRTSMLGIASRILGIVDFTLGLMRYPLGMSFTLFCMMLLCSSMWNSAVDMMQGALQNLCVLPVFSHLPHCAPHFPFLRSKSGSGADFPSLMNIQNKALDELAGRSGLGSALALNLKHAEVSVKDLVVAVQASNLTAKQELASVLAAFVGDARTASRSVQEVSTKINGFMDR